MKALINAMVYDFNQFQKNGYVIFDDTIVDTGSMDDFVDQGYTVIDCKGNLVMPGLVVGHTHIYSTFARGLALPFNPKNFQEILDQMWWKLDHHLDNTATFYSGIVSGVDMVKNGVTSVLDHHASGKDITGSLEALKQSVCDHVGLRGAFCFEVSDRFNVSEAIAENRAFIDTYKTTKIRGHFGLHASLSLSESSLKKIAGVVGDDPIHIHVGESQLDQDDCMRQYGERVIERLARHQLLNKDSIITHALFVSDHELDLIKSHGCVVALNVNSNMNNGVGLPLVKKLKAKNIPIIIGNDGLSTTVTTEYLTLLYTTHLKETAPTAFDLGDLLQIIHDTYAYLERCFEIKIGKIQKNYVADVLVVPYVAPTPIHNDNALGHLFYGMFHSFKPSDVFIGGKHVVKDYSVSDDLMKNYTDAQIVSSELWKSIQNKGEE